MRRDIAVWTTWDEAIPIGWAIALLQPVPAQVTVATNGVFLPQPDIIFRLSGLGFIFRAVTILWLVFALYLVLFLVLLLASLLLALPNIFCCW